MLEILFGADAKGGKKAFMVSNLALLLILFLSDGAASMAVKGLISPCLWCERDLLSYLRPVQFKTGIAGFGLSVDC